MHWRGRFLFLALCFVVAAGALAWRLSDIASTPSVRFRVVQRLYQPAGGVVPDPARLAGQARERWSADDIRMSWTRVQSARSATLRSPRLELPHDFYAVIVTRTPGAENPGPALVLWSDTTTLEPAQFARNRRQLSNGRLTTATVLPAETLQSDGRRPVRYLFLHLPDGGDVGETVDAVALVTARDLATAGAGATRLAADGQTRDALSSRTPIAYRASVPDAADLAFGVRVDGDAGTIRVTQTTNAGEQVIVEGAVAARRWVDLRVPLRASDDSTIRFSASVDNGSHDAPVYWSVPQILARDLTARRPNILLYVVDALRADKLGLYGSSKRLSPFLDELGAQSVVFRRAYAAASWTKPSVTTLLTSLYPGTHAVGARHYADGLPANVTTLQSELARAGYVTAQFSSNPFTGPVSSLDRGFDVAFMASALGQDSAFQVKAADVNARLIAWITEHRADQFFAYAHTVDTHPPFAGATSAEGPETNYESAIAAVDREIRGLHAELGRLGVRDNTVILVTADHGEAFGEHGHNGHGQSVYDEEVRVPLIIHAPSRLAARWIDEPVHMVDVMPTVLELAGVHVDGGALQGRSLLTADGAARAGSPVVFTRFTYPDDVAAPAEHVEMHAIVDYPWKLIAVDRAAAPRTIELYRLDQDPGERRDLSGTESARARQLTAVLDGFLQEQSRAHDRFARAHEGPLKAPVPARDLVEQLRSLGYIR